MSEKANKFSHLQLRSVLDEPGSAPDPTWADMVAVASLHSNTVVAVTLPSTEVAEDALLDAVEALSAALSSEQALIDFHRHFGWSSPEDYFGSLGEVQTMLVDVDHNDLDDRLAIIITAFQMASANLARRRRGGAAAGAACCLYLDGRTYESKNGLTTWRTVRLAARLQQLMDSLGTGLSVIPILGDRERAQQLVADYLGLPGFDAAALNARAEGTAAILEEEGGSVASLLGSLRPGSQSSLWLLSGLCPAQVMDILGCSEAAEVSFNIFEQAQPAWQSIDMEQPSDLGAEPRQPSWSFPPHPPSDVGFGAEPSNIRSSEEGYAKTIETYVRFQQLVASTPARFTYVIPALARNDGFMPAPPGQPMLKVSGRPLKVLPGKEYVVKKAVNGKRAAKVFAGLLASAYALQPDTIYAELCTSTANEAGVEHPELAHVTKYGTFMADAITVAMASRPHSQLGTTPVMRRLAIVRVPP